MKQANLNFVLKAAFASFGAYFCMYAFRKPFAVASFEGLSYWNIDYKIILVIAQVLGYTLSKFLGIRIISEMKPKSRLNKLLGFILFAELTLLGFALVPAPYNIIFMFLNGLPLGMIWGIVFSYIEGRKSSELLGVILCSSFIVSSGIVKSVGKFVLDNLQVSEFFMPFITGLIFLVPLYIFAKLLERLPFPTLEDISAKRERKPMLRADRKAFFKEFYLPMIIIIIFYTIITAVRDFRDNFAREIWDSLGYQDSASIYSLSELPIAIAVLLILAVVGSMKNNKNAFKIYHIILFLGSVSVAVSTLLFQANILSPVWWMIISGFGMYICYVPFNGLYFDRMIATLQLNGNVGLLIYLADSFGYLGSVAILLYKNFGHANLSWLEFFIWILYSLAITGLVASIGAFLAFFNSKRISYEKAV